jgi:hypothetical protein
MFTDQEDVSLFLIPPFLILEVRNSSRPSGEWDGTECSSRFTGNGGSGGSGGNIGSDKRPCADRENWELKNALCRFDPTDTGGSSLHSDGFLCAP